MAGEGKKKQQGVSSMEICISYGQGDHDIHLNCNNRNLKNIQQQKGNIGQYL